MKWSNQARSSQAHNFFGANKPQNFISRTVPSITTAPGPTSLLLSPRVPPSAAATVPHYSSSQGPPGQRPQLPRSLLVDVASAVALPNSVASIEPLDPPPTTSAVSSTPSVTPEISSDARGTPPNTYTSWHPVAFNGRTNARRDIRGPHQSHCCTQ